MADPVAAGPTPQSVTSDPNFQSLSGDDKVQVMMRLLPNDPAFMSLQPNERMKVANGIRQKFTQPEEPGLWDTLKNDYNVGHEKLQEALAPNPQNLSPTTFGQKVRAGSVIADPEVYKTVGRGIVHIEDSLLHMPGSVYDAFTQPPTDEEKKSIEPEVLNNRARLGARRLSGIDPVTYASRAYTGSPEEQYTRVDTMKPKEHIGFASNPELHQTVQTSEAPPPVTLENALSVAPEAIAEGSANMIAGKVSEMAGGEIANRVGAHYAAKPAQWGVEGAQNIQDALRTPAGKGGVRAASMEKAIQTAAPDLAEIERSMPTQTQWLRSPKAQTFGELADKIDAKQDQLWDAHTEMVNRPQNATLQIDPKIYSQASHDILTEVAEKNAPASAAAVRTWLDSVKDIVNIKQADELVRRINAQMKNVGEVSTWGDLGVAARQQVVRGLRNQIEEALVRNGEEGVRDINRRWGALDEINNRVKEMGAQEALREVKGNQSLLPDWARVYGFLHPGSLEFSVGLGIKAASLMKTTPAKLLVKGMKNLALSDLKAGLPVAPSFTPYGLLGPGARPMPAAPDTSGSVPYNPPPVASTTRAARLGLLLPEPKKVIPMGSHMEPIAPPSAPQSTVPYQPSLQQPPAFVRPGEIKPAQGPQSLLFPEQTPQSFPAGEFPEQPSLFQTPVNLADVQSQLFRTSVDTIRANKPLDFARLGKVLTPDQIKVLKVLQARAAKK